ncbi:MAG: zinc metallopeptidase [Verrucomicrobia bacterium]|nr:MAG: zinc metallopeptidase [Verrucomicrobiota bacterium]
MLAFFYIDPYFWVTIPGALIAIWAQMRLSSAISKYSQIRNVRGMTGGEVARMILDRNGMANVEIYPVEGSLSDHYDPSRRAVFLSDAVRSEASVAAVGVAAHEVGHAIQHKASYAPLGMRMAMVGITGFASSAAWIAIAAGMLLGSFGHAGGLGRTLVLVGVILFSVVVLFQVVTLPVEYDASARAKRELQRLGLVAPDEAEGVELVLNAAALTYVAGMVTAILELVHLLLILRGSRRDDDR